MPCGELSVKCGYVQQYHCNVMIAVDGKQIPQKPNTNPRCLWAWSDNSQHL